MQIEDNQYKTLYGSASYGSDILAIRIQVYSSKTDSFADDDGDLDRELWNFCYKSVEGIKNRIESMVYQKSAEYSARFP